MPNIRTKHCHTTKIKRRTATPKGPKMRQYNQTYNSEEATTQLLPDNTHPEIICLASLYKPMEFLRTKIDNFNAVLPPSVAVWFADCSPPEVWQEVQETIRQHSKFKYILSHFHERTTLYYTWNWIIKHAILTYGPKYFCNTNVDDIIGPDYFTIMPQVLNGNPAIQLVACSWYVISGSWTQKWPPASCDGICTVTEIGSCGHFPMWRAGLHKQIGLFDPNMLAIGDSDFWSRIKNALGQEVMHKINDVLCCYISHQNNLYHTSKGPNMSSGEAWDRGTISVRTPEELDRLRYF